MKISSLLVALVATVSTVGAVKQTSSSPFERRVLKKSNSHDGNQGGGGTFAPGECAICTPDNKIRPTSLTVEYVCEMKGSMRSTPSLKKMAGGVGGLSPRQQLNFLARMFQDISYIPFSKIV